MKYSISRSSDLFSESAPCKKAALVPGSEHDTPVYEIEINTLEELMELVRENGKVIVGKNWIEIYDDYRE